MEPRPLVKIGTRIPTPRTLETPLKCEIYDGFYHYPERIDTVKRVASCLSDYLVKHLKIFKKASFMATPFFDTYLPNGTLTGMISCINRSEVDVGISPIAMNELSKDIVDFAYPYQIVSRVFLTRKPEYKPHIFGILQSLALSLWITIIAVLIAMSLMHYVVFKRKHAVDKTTLQVIGVLLRQSSILRLSCMAENLLVYSWVVGAMFLCLAYDSVFLSFLAIPPLNQVRNIDQLAKAVEREDYHCVIDLRTGLLEFLRYSKSEKIRVIAKDVMSHNLDVKDFCDHLVGLRKYKRNLAYLGDELSLSMYSGIGVVSEDHFQESLPAMTVRKDFCCKKALETFVHKMMASGIYHQYLEDFKSYTRMKYAQYFEKETTQRKLNHVDVAPAFIFLILGHFIAFLVFIGEILLSRWKKTMPLKKDKKRRKKIKLNEESV